MHPLGAIIIGLIAGWIAGKLMRGRGYGIIADIVLGLIWSYNRQLDLYPAGNRNKWAPRIFGDGHGRRRARWSAPPTYSGPSAISAQFAV